MKRKLIVLSPLVLLLIGFIAMRVLSSFQDEKPKRPTVVRPKVVETAVVELQDVNAKLVTYGTIASKQPVTLISEVSGTLLEGDLPFQPAQAFKKGDLLLRVDDRQIQLEMNGNRSDLLTALSSLLPEIKVSSPADFQVWQSYFDSISFDRKIADLPEATDQRIKALLARYNIYKLYFAVRNQEIRADKHYFYAPFDGSIVSTQLRVGSTAAPGTRLAELINLEDLEVEIQIPAEDIVWLSDKAPASLTTSDGKQSWSGYIDRIGGNIDDRTQSVQAFVKLDAIKEAAPLVGVFVDATIEAQVIPNAIEVSRRAVYEEEYVYVIENGAFQKREISISFDEGDFYVITDGLFSGDTLVTELLQGVAPGMPAISREASP